MVEIRCISSADNRKLISKIYETGWRYAYKGIIPQDFLDTILEGQWADKIDQDGRYTQLALDGKHIVGVVSYGMPRFSDLEGYGEIYSIYLLPEYIGKGIGTALLSSAIKALSDIGYTNIFLWVLEENTQARYFYEHRGFVCDNVYASDNIGGKNIGKVRYIFNA